MFRHTHKQTTPAAPILFNVFIMMSVIICCGNEGKTEHKEEELESKTFRDGKTEGSNIFRLLSSVTFLLMLQQRIHVKLQGLV